MRRCAVRDVLTIRRWDGGNGGEWIVFEKRHVQGERKDKALSLLTSFRSYLHYHLKCSKAYMHSRMRARTGTCNRLSPHPFRSRGNDRAPVKRLMGFVW